VGADLNRPTVELIALVASAGGLEALSTVLADLPADLPVAIVVQQHLGGHDSVLPTLLGRQAARRVAWARNGQTLTPGAVLVCPPGMHLEFSDGRCRLRKMASIGERRFDVLLASMARSYGPRSVGVVLSGSGQDGAAGTAAMKRAGAIVIAEGPDTGSVSVDADRGRAGRGRSGVAN
jgi:two-component system, chemotaxis family, protein-glutamate methylesterase/glutaminase